MKKNLFLSALLILSPAVLAAPSMYPKCSNDVKVPAEGGTHFFDEDCKTVYVAPHHGRVDLKLLSENSDIKLVCEHISANMKDMLKLDRENMTDLDRLKKAMAAGKDYKALLDEVDKAREARIRKQEALFGDIVDIASREAAVVEVRYYSGLEKSLEEYRRANPDLKIEPLPLITPVINIIEKSEKDYRRETLDPEISLQFDQVEIDPSLKAAKFHEGISAKLRLSYIGACTASYPSQLGAHVVGNLTYAFQISGETRYGTAALAGQ